MDESLKKNLEDAIKIVNFIEAMPKNFMMFGVLCDEMGSEHKQLLLLPRFGDCQKVKCSQDCLNSTKNSGFFLWKVTVIENLPVPTKICDR